MLFNRKNNMKTKKSDYQVLKDIILKNDNQTSYDDVEERKA